MNAQITQLLKTLQTHPWLSHALGVIVVIVSLNVFMGLRAANVLIEKQADQLSLQKNRLEAISQRKTPASQLGEIRSRLALLQGRLGKAPTPAIAQANVQDALSLLQRQYDLRNARVQVGSLEPVAGQADLAEIKAQVDFEFSRTTLLPVLAALSDQPPTGLITDLNFRNQDNSRVSVGVSYYYYLSSDSSNR